MTDQTEKAYASEYRRLARQLTVVLILFICALGLLVFGLAEIGRSPGKEEPLPLIIFGVGGVAAIVLIGAQFFLARKFKALQRKTAAPAHRTNP